MNERFSKSYTPEQAFAKAKHYCAYQERCHKEVKEKLYSLGLRKNDVETLLSRLIEEGFLNEERFATLFAGGKFRIKQWGKAKIIYELKRKGISEYNIKKAISAIDESGYHEMVFKEASKKWEQLKQEQHFTRQAKTRNYLLRRGFELNDIKIALQKLTEKADNK